MYHIDIRFVKNELAANKMVFARGENLYLLGLCRLVQSHPGSGIFTYVVGGGSREYEVKIALDTNSGIKSTSCTCPYPHDGCKHVVASCLDIKRRIEEHRLMEVQADPFVSKTTIETKENTGLTSSKVRANRAVPIPAASEAMMLKTPSKHTHTPYLSPEEIRSQALQSRIERAGSESFKLMSGDTYVGVHHVRHISDEPYTITVYDPVKRLAHCTCPDFAVNNLQTCKHLIFAFKELDKRFMQKNTTTHDNRTETPLPFVHITWNSQIRKPICHIPVNVDSAVSTLLEPLFDERGDYRLVSLKPLFDLYRDCENKKSAVEAAVDIKAGSQEIKSKVVPTFRFDQRLLEKIDEVFFDEQVANIEKEYNFDMSFLKTELYPYQTEGIRFATFKRSAILADEMGLGKTLQAIATACLKKEVFGIERVLIVCPASLKRQWKQEIEKFTDYKALLLEGSPAWRRHTIIRDKTFFKIMNYEMILRDIDAIKQQPPDLVILDEAQRIKNFATKTHQAIKQIPRSHSLVLTGTPLENKLEDLYSIVQFCNPETLSPLWAFAAQHYRLSRERGNKILGYHNLELVQEKIKPLLLRRSKAEVFDSLPDITRSRIVLEPTEHQMRHHQGYLQSLQGIIRKKILTPIDIQRMQMLLLRMRMVCDASCLVDDTCKNTSSPKLEELESLLRDVVVEGNRKVIIFSEWTSMTALVGAVVSKLGLDFVEFTGKVPVKKRQLLIDEFRNNPSCMVFIASDAGGVGLNLQNCDFLINMELPWNPAKLNQRIGRIHRIGQKSNKIHVVDMVMSRTIEEKIATGLGLKQDLFDAVFAGKTTEVDFNREGRSQFINQINALLQNMQPDRQSDTDEVITKPELDESDPHYLNPKLLGDENTMIEKTISDPDSDSAAQGVTARETEPSGEIDLGEEYSKQDLVSTTVVDTGIPDVPEGIQAHADESFSSETQKGPSPFDGSTATTASEQLQTVLNQGLAFLNTLAQMSTGKALFKAGSTNPVEIDPDTNEVILRFKLD